MKTNLLIVILLCIGIGYACKPKTDDTGKNPDGSYYTCSMHPEIRMNHPGKCPVCKMELIIAHDQVNGSNNSITLNTRQIFLAGIKTDTVKYGMIGESTILSGKIVADPSKETMISLRVSGRIDKLYVNTPGQQVNPGDPLFDIYSEDLLSAEKEYHLLVANSGSTGLNLEFAKASENKLKLWGLSAIQIKEIAAGHISQPDITIYSNAGGTVSEIMIKEGVTVMEGAGIIKLSDYSTLWVEAQQYANASNTVTSGENVMINIPAFGETNIPSKISFVYPEVLSNSKITLVRAELKNPGLKYRPGMEARIILTHKTKKALLVPSGAIQLNKMGPSVWIRKADKSFEIKMVETGIESNGSIEIISGLQPGEIIVSSGSYLLNSEYILKKNADPMAGMKM
jgi:membrane fusion protein, copper/silver efflux system